MRIALDKLSGIDPAVVREYVDDLPSLRSRINQLIEGIEATATDPALLPLAHRGHEEATFDRCDAWGVCARCYLILVAEVIELLALAEPTASK